MRRRFHPMTSGEALGTWGVGPFQNDAAGDYLDDLAEADDLIGSLRRTMSTVVGAGGRIDGRAGDQAFAAASLVASCTGSIDDVPQIAAKFLAAHPFEWTADLLQLAGRTFDRLLSPESNVWYELWAEANAIGEIAAAMEPYRQAVRPR